LCGRVLAKDEADGDRLRAVDHGSRESLVGHAAARPGAGPLRAAVLLGVVQGGLLSGDEVVIENDLVELG
jgi:hypothetical protein